MSANDLTSIWITVQLAGATTICLLVIGTPLARWLSLTKSWLKPPIEAIVTLPLVLPPTVLGFYFLIFLSPNSAIGSFVLELTGSTLTFSFSGLVLASVIYSLPFMVQPLQVAFENLGRETLETTASLRVRPITAFFTVVAPTSIRGFISAIVLTFAHTVGEFGVVLMVGGNIPGETRVLSIAIYEHVEIIAYTDAHVLAALLMVFSFATLLTVFIVNRQMPFRTA